MGTETREAAVAYVDMEVKGGESIRQAVTAAAKKFGLKSESIRSFYRRRKKTKNRQHGHQLLTDDEELALAGLAETCSRVCCPLTRTELIDAVRGCKRLPETWNGWHWVDGFLDRHDATVRMGS